VVSDDVKRHCELPMLLFRIVELRSIGAIVDALPMIFMKIELNVHHSLHNLPL
jgi:hypothetical protein